MDKREREERRECYESWTGTLLTFVGIPLMALFPLAVHFSPRAKPVKANEAQVEPAPVPPATGETVEIKGPEPQ